MSRNRSASTLRHPGIALGVMTAALAITLVPGIAAAQDPTPPPSSVTVQAVPVDPGTAGGTITVSEGTIVAGTAEAGLVPLGCVGPQTVTLSSDGLSDAQGGPFATCTVADFGGFGEPALPGESSMGGLMSSGQAMASAPVMVSGPMMVSGQAMACGEAMMVGPMGPDMGASGAAITVSAQPAHLVTVSSVNGSTVSLATDDGWTRDLDTANVAITLDTDTLSAVDLAAGDQVLVVQVRNANDTYTVTGLQLILPEVTGTVSDVTAEGFSVAGMDGTTTTVRVSDATDWPGTVPGAPATGLSTLKDGDLVAARGKLSEDGSMDASSVMVASGFTMSTAASGMIAPSPAEAPTASPKPSPEG